MLMVQKDCQLVRYTLNREISTTCAAPTSAIPRTRRPYMASPSPLGRRHRAGPEAFPGVEAPEDLRCLARNGLREISARELKARGPGRTPVFYPAGHGGSFAGGRWRGVLSRSACRGSKGRTSTTPGDACPGGADGEGLFGAGAHLHHVRRLQDFLIDR